LPLKGPFGDLAPEGLSVDIDGERCAPFAAKAIRPSRPALAGLPLSQAKQPDTDPGVTTKTLHQTSRLATRRRLLGILLVS